MIALYTANKACIIATEAFVRRNSYFTLYIDSLTYITVPLIENAIYLYRVIIKCLATIEIDFFNYFIPT